MEKILFIVFGANPTIQAMNFACYLSDVTHSKLTGFFSAQEKDASVADTSAMLT
ncbi:MAG TPA: hypothetical protein VM802_09395 [Chitinophaga sp.]|uniref:hypothetical protein n=1 Tax=Chitinophaga sp. TaxID=1869181 RepID=UPI002CAD353B|nr:hypothetical protein [Chitinophaga sp.]HVI45075.1 hypothetical protein [Chitinophaga sp.]